MSDSLIRKVPMRDFSRFPGSLNLLLNKLVASDLHHRQYVARWELLKQRERAVVDPFGYRVKMFAFDEDQMFEANETLAMHPGLLHAFFSESSLGESLRNVRVREVIGQRRRENQQYNQGNCRKGSG